MANSKSTYLLILVIVFLNVSLSQGKLKCERFSSSELASFKVCNLTSYNNTYFYDKSTCLSYDNQLVGLIESFSETYWKNQYSYPSDCLEEFVKYTCSQACPICEATLTKPLSNYTESDLDKLFKSDGRGLPTCPERCDSFTQHCSDVPGISKMVEHSKCLNFTSDSVSSQGVTHPKQTCTNHKNTLIKNNTDIGSPQALGYATCDAGHMSTFNRLICALPSGLKASTAPIWNDRAGEGGNSTCMEKDHSLNDLLPQFVATFESSSLCVKDYDTCLEAYSSFVCSLSCPYCTGNQTKSPCKSKCDALVSACAGLPVLGITARMDCSRYSNTNCTDMNSKNVDDIIDENSSQELQECKMETKREVFQTEKEVDGWTIKERNEDIIHKLMKYRHEPQTKKLRKNEPECLSLKQYSKTKQSEENKKKTIDQLQVCMVGETDQLSSVEECLSMDQRLSYFLETFSEVQDLDRLERPYQLSCLQSYTSFLCSSACKPCNSEGICQETCQEFKDECSLWPNSFGMSLSSPGIASEFQSQFWTPSPLRSLQANIDCSLFPSNSTNKNLVPCSNIASSLGEIGWIYNIDHSFKKGKLNLSWEYGSSQHKSTDSSVRFSVYLVETNSPKWNKVDTEKLPVQIADNLKKSHLKFKAPEGKHTFSIIASFSSPISRSTPSQSPVATRITLDI